MQAAAVKALRTEQGMTQVQFAEAIGADPITVSRWERGEQAMLAVYARMIETKFGRNQPATKSRKKPASR